jgi:integrase
LLTLDAARDDAKRKLLRLMDGIDPAAKRKKASADRTVSETIDCYMREHVAKNIFKKTSRWDIKTSTHMLRERLSERLLSSLTHRDFGRWKEDCKETPVSWNHATGYWRTIFRFCTAHEFIKDRLDPSIAVKRYPVYSRRRILSSPEYARFGDAIARCHNLGISDTVRHAILLLIFTRARKTEIFGLRWDQVDRDSGLLRIDDHKTDQKREVKMVPITPEVGMILDERERIVGNPYVFPSPHSSAGRTHLKSIDNAWAKLLKVAKLTDFTLHDLRRGVISYGIVLGGASLESMAATIGHADPRTTARAYFVVEEKHRKEVANRASATMAKLLGRLPRLDAEETEDVSRTA